jgi:uncharacterized protein
VVRSVSQRMRNKFGAAVAEVADNDAWQLATIGVAVVSNSGRHCREMLDEIESFVRESRLDAEVVDVEADVIPLDD